MVKVSIHSSELKGLSQPSEYIKNKLSSEGISLAKFFSFNGETKAKLTKEITGGTVSFTLEEGK